MKKILLFSALLMASFQTKAEKIIDEKYLNKLTLKGGIGLSYVDLMRGSSDDQFATPLLNTQFSIYMGDLELTANANMSFGKVNELNYQLEDNNISGVGKIIDVSIGPILKYRTNLSFKSGKWPFYIGAGPAWSLYSISFSNDPQVKELNYDINVNEYKLSYDTFGYNLILGIEEVTPLKSMNPVYIELTYSYRRSRKLSLVDTEKFEEIDVALEQEDKTFKYHSVILTMGVTFF